MLGEGKIRCALNPETGQEQAKRAYVIKVGDDWYVGSGMYVQ